MTRPAPARVLLLFVLGPLSAAAQPAASPTSVEPNPPLRRWLELQALSLMTRYRFVENSAEVTTASQWQYKDVVRARLNIDSARRYTINVGVFTGTTFIGTWNNTGVGKGAPQEFVASHFMKQLFASATPVVGFELQYGGLYVVRGESTEWTTYDDDGYLVGERLSLRRKELFFDEIAGTRALIGPFDTPDLTERWRGLHEANYYQALVAKSFGGRYRASADFTRDQGRNTVRGGVAATFGRRAPFSTIRYEQYWRTNATSAFGFALWLERPITKHARLQCGYATVDEHYGGWNADRIQRGKRAFAIGTVPIAHELSASVFLTQAFPAAYPISNRTRLDLILTYDLLRTLRRTGLF